MRKNKFLMKNKERGDNGGERRGDKRLSLAPPGYNNYNICYQVIITSHSNKSKNIVTSPSPPAPPNSRRKHRLLLSRSGSRLPGCPPQRAGAAGNLPAPASPSDHNLLFRVNITLCQGTRRPTSLSTFQTFYMDWRWRKKNFS